MNRNAAMKQKCKEELLLWESEPMPDLTQESEADQCEFLAQQHPGKFPTFQILVACYVGGSRGSNPTERHWFEMQKQCWS